MKPIVHYRGAAEIRGNHALLCPIDHPNHYYVSNTGLVLTSAIVAHDKATGRIETRNTIYLPEAV